MEKNTVKMLKKMLDFSDSNRMAVEALYIFVPSKRNRKKCIAVFCTMLIPAAFIGISENTIPAMQNASDVLASAILSIFGIVFTGYVFFQALINKTLLVKLINDIKEDIDPEKEKSKLQEANEEFVHLMMLCIMLTALDLITGICLNAFPDNVYLFRNGCANNMIAIVLIIIFFYLNAVVLWDVKSFIFNIFQLFSMHAVTKAMEIEKEENRDAH